MKILGSWFNFNKQLLNTKSNLMLFGTHGQLQSQSDIKVTQHDEEIDMVSQNKHLGVVLDPQLNLSAHTGYLKSRTLGKIGLLGRIRSFVDHETSLMLYRTLILPLFDYCDFPYHCLCQRDQYILQKLQNCSLRIIIQCRKLTPTGDLHEL